MTDLRACYDALATRVGPLEESFEVVEAVERLRRFWRPTQVRVLLLAESHVFTSRDELGIRLKSSLLPPSYPSQFSRFVYCLGCGESDLLDRRPDTNAGTPQFWKILQACQSEIAFQEVTKSGNRDFESRIRAKIRLLTQLRESGVWLVDASITALYHRAQRPVPQKVTEILRTCWDAYVGDVIRNAAPKSIIVIGKGVLRALVEQIKGTGIHHHVVEQPNARVSSNKRADVLAEVAKICGAT